MTRRAAWMAYLVWGLLFLAAFLAVYIPCNALTARRGWTLVLHLPAERAIPFRPEFIWAYASMLLLWPLQPLLLPAWAIRAVGMRMVAATLLAGLCFLALPARLGFDRSLPSDPLLAALYRGLFALDHPHNLVPSLHVLNSALLLLTFREHTDSGWGRAAWLAWLTLIAGSTLLVHQHHLLDLTTALAAAVALHRWAWRIQTHSFDSRSSPLRRG